MPRSSARTVSSVEALVGLVGSCALLFSRTIDRGSGRAGVDWVDCQRVPLILSSARTAKPRMSVQLCLVGMLARSCHSSSAQVLSELVCGLCWHLLLRTKFPPPPPSYSVSMWRLEWVVLRDCL